MYVVPVAVTAFIGTHGYLPPAINSNFVALFYELTCWE